MTGRLQPHDAFAQPARIPDEVQQRAHALVREFATGKPTEADRDLIRLWRAQSAQHEQAWNQACRDWRQLGSAARVLEARQPSEAASGRQPSSRGGYRGRRWFLGAVSAAGTLAAVSIVYPHAWSWLKWSSWAADYRTAIGEQKSLALDGERLRVLLNTDSSLRVRTSGATPSLELLDGEAAVSVARAQPCDILAGVGRIRLAVADVEVRRHASGLVQVHCASGNAQLDHPRGQVAIKAGQALSYDAERLGQVQAAMAGASAWRDRVVEFHDQTLAQVVREINRYRPGRVILVDDTLAQRRLSARVSMDAMHEVIQHIEHLYGARVRTVGGLLLLG